MGSPTTFLAVVALLLLLGVSFANGSSGLYPKQRSGPPTEFARMRLPAPTAGAIDARSAWFSMQLTLDADGSTGSWEYDLPCDSDQELKFVFYSPLLPKLALSLLDPNGKAFPLQDHVVDGSYVYSSTGASIPGDGYDIPNPIVGMWHLEVRVMEALTQEERASVQAQGPDGYVLMYTDRDEAILAHLSTYKLTVDSYVGLTAQLFDSSLYEPIDVNGTFTRPPALKQQVRLAAMQVTKPDGTVVDVPMHDDGDHLDAEPGDGVYGAKVEAMAPGFYRAQAVFEGVNEHGSSYIRTSQHLLSVVHDRVNLDGTATSDASAAVDQIDLKLGVSVGTVGHKYRAYAEVWGISTVTGQPAPACWISSQALVTADAATGALYIPMEFNVRWLSQAGVRAPLTLHNVYLQDSQAHIPVDELDTIHVKPVAGDVNALAEDRLAQYGSPEKFTHTREMLQGRIPEQLKMLNNSAEKHGFVLSHGYCAQQQPWETAPDSPWTGNTYYFADLDKSRNTDDFATMLVNDVQANSGFTSWGILGHSQGGMVAVHIHNYYWTPLELSATTNDHRRIQTVGTPYHGSTGAGSSANLVKIFGVGCGANFDISRDGGELWLAGISADARKDVYFYRTQYKKSGLVKYCNLAVNMVLKWPNDGCTEVQYSAIEGGNDMGLTAGQCHTTGMHSPPQYYDTSRNVVINQEAAR